MWWMAAAWAADAGCPAQVIEGHRTATGSGTASSREAAEVAAGKDALARLLDPWCGPAPGSYWCHRVTANAGRATQGGG